MRITIVINKLSGGGAEKVAVDLANNLSKEFNVSVITLQNSKEVFNLKNTVERFRLNINSESSNILIGFLANLRRLFFLRKSIIESDPDVVISFMNRTNVRVLISLIFTRIPVIITEHNYPKMNPMKKEWEILRKLIYKRAKFLVSVSKGVSDCFHYISESKKKVIYNLIDLDFHDDEELCIDLRKKNITAMGRLTYIKGFDLLIEAFSLISNDFLEWNLNIIGDGDSYNFLKQKISNLSLNNRVFLLGFKKAPHKILEKSDLFVLSSRSEGFGNVIIEAMRCGVPVLSTDCPVGPREIIKHGVTGILVENENVYSIKNGLSQIMKSNNLRETLSTNAKKEVEKFSNEKILKDWKEIFYLIKPR